MEDQVYEGCERVSAQQMDEERQSNIAYEYLCHLQEAKVWIESCINEELPATTELEEGLRNGVYVAKLSHFFAPQTVPLKKIYDLEQNRYCKSGLHFRHTDNINHWMKAMTQVGFPSIFVPETTDLYERKNMPKVVYCLHALSLFLYKQGLGPKMQDLYGKVNFTEEEISAMRKELEKYGIEMPAFSKIGGILANEMPVDEAALHAAIIAINEAIDRSVPADLLTSLQNPAAMLYNIEARFFAVYLDFLKKAKIKKSKMAQNKSFDQNYVADAYDELLTREEIQDHIDLVNCLLMGLDNLYRRWIEYI